MKDVINSLQTTIVTSPRDYSIDKRDAWIYGIVVGWDDALDEVSKKHNWDDETINSLKTLRGIVEKLE